MGKVGLTLNFYIKNRFENNKKNVMRVGPSDIYSVAAVDFHVISIFKTVVNTINLPYGGGGVQCIIV